MIWIQFSSAPDAPPSTTFMGTDVEVWIKVLTKPYVEGITVAGHVRLPDGSPASLTFDESGVASLKLDEHQKGKYKVEATVSKDGYQDATLTADFYYVDEPEEISELDFVI